jgi:hypothetical protein
VTQLELVGGIAVSMVLCGIQSGPDRFAGFASAAVKISGTDLNGTKRKVTEGDEK